MLSFYFILRSCPFLCIVSPFPKKKDDWSKVCYRIGRKHTMLTINYKRWNWKTCHRRMQNRTTASVCVPFGSICCASDDIDSHGKTSEEKKRAKKVTKERFSCQESNRKLRCVISSFTSQLNCVTESFYVTSDSLRFVNRQFWWRKHLALWLSYFILHQTVWGAPPASSDGENIKLCDWVILCYIRPFGAVTPSFDELILQCNMGLTLNWMSSVTHQFNRTNKKLRRAADKYPWGLIAACCSDQ